MPLDQRIYPALRRQHEAREAAEPASLYPITQHFDAPLSAAQIEAAEACIASWRGDTWADRIETARRGAMYGGGDNREMSALLSRYRVGFEAGEIVPAHPKAEAERKASAIEAEALRLRVMAAQVDEAA